MATGAPSGYRPELDGIRAFAIVGVLLFHAARISPIRLLGGEYGVDLFFVLSGLLITTLLLREHDRTATIRLGAFYVRRVLRLTPALLVMLAAGGVVAVLIDSFRTGLTYPQAATAAFFAVGNWLHGSGRSLQLLTHTWSLAIEWQFYLLWPPILLVALRRGIERRHLAMVATAGAVLVALARAVAYHELGRNQALFWTITRCDGVLIGCALALAIADGGRIVRVLRRRSVALVATAGAAFGVAVLRADSRYMYDGGLFALIVCFAVAVGHVTVRADGGFARALTIPPLPQLGRISYGVYLYHVLIYALVRHDPVRRSIGWALIAMAASIVVALVSYIVVELPALRLKDRIRDARGRREGTPAPQTGPP